MYRFKIIYLLSFVVIQTLSAQNKGVVIRGKVTDEKRNPVSLASIFIARDTLSAPLAGAVSDTSGVFHLSVNQTGHFVVQVKFLGYKIFKKRISIGEGTSLDLGTVVLRPLEKQLSGVEVVKRRPLVEQKIDRLVFHAEDFTGTAGGNALDVLQLTPRLLVSPGQISIIGKHSVTVLWSMTE